MIAYSRANGNFTAAAAVRRLYLVDLHVCGNVMGISDGRMHRHGFALGVISVGIKSCLGEAGHREKKGCWEIAWGLKVGFLKLF